MDHKMIALLIGVALLCAATATLSSSVRSCCITVSNKITKRVLKHVKCFEIQKTQLCDIKAVILHVGKRKLCVDPTNSMLSKWMQEKKSPKKCKAQS